MALGKQLAGRPHVKVGFLQATAARTAAGGGDPPNVSNVELAVILHFGTADNRIPPRPFFLAAVKRRRRAWRRQLGGIGRNFLKGSGNLSLALATLGERAVAHVRSAMRSIGVPDAASTLAEKDTSRPLIDSKQLLEAVTFEVRPRG